MRAERKPVVPGPGQESVWDYPRPPRLEPVADRLRVVFAGKTVADSVRGWRVLETSHPPVYYLPAADVVSASIRAARGQSWCEFKGRAQYWSLQVGAARSDRAAWSYPMPAAPYAAIKDHFAFYASAVDACWVGDQRAHAQSGDFYGGWITPNVVGPFKGEPGTLGW